MKFSYADNVAILQLGQTLTECIEKLDRQAKILLDWGIQNAISFDHQKSELQHFTLATKPKEYPSLLIGNTFLQANQVTRWLGVWLDRKLSFLTHTRNWTAKGMVVAAHLRRLNNTMKGCPPYLLRQAVTSCVLLVVLYGIEAWWPEDHILARRRKKLQELKHRCGKQIQLLSKAIHMSLRTILPIYCSTPLPILFRERGLPPTRIMLEEIKLRKALRIQNLDARHPMRKRAYSVATTRLTKTAHLLPISVDTELANFDKESPNPPKIYNSTNHDVHVYSDGAILPDGRSGGAFVLYQAERKIPTQSFSIGYKVEPIDTEIIAINYGIQKAFQKAAIHFATNIIMFTDNQTATNIVNGNSSPKSRKEVTEIRKTQQDWKSRNRLPHTQSGNIFACWIPGHANIRGNEEADCLAKQGAQSANGQCLTNRMSYAMV
ncbi:hypothetical protein EPUL_006271 [Erysiphe pulchra]|uniref:RNase H type-1 domain-containing protein n=1 Tax=Erysiphe pulchra TaxID=225359 RepID=A0A2S4PJQ5_9PEZI|nr:hypothetical protein EPUL_006271 [Erysiphe pulchra]